MSHLSVRKYRESLGLNLEDFAALFNKSKGHFSAIENADVCSPELALEIEAHSRGQVDAARLSGVIAAARKQVA